MGEHISNFFALIRRSKKQIVFAIFSFAFFLLFLFPLDDLSDFITGQIAKNTQNQVFLAFSDLNISMLPIGLSLENVSVDTPFAPTLKASKLSLSPSIASLLAFKQGFVASASGLFGGDVSLDYKTGKEINDELNYQNIELEIDEASMKEISKLVDLPVTVNGQADANVVGEFDPSFKIPPKSEFNLLIKKVSIPASTVATAMGPLNVPGTSFENVNVKGRLLDGKLYIEEAVIGSPTDAINGRITGNMNVNVASSGNRVFTNFGAYELKIDMNFSKQAEADLGLFLGFIGDFKTLTGKGSRYALQLRGADFNSPPNMSKL